MTTPARPTFESVRDGRGKGEDDLSHLLKQFKSLKSRLKDRAGRERERAIARERDLSKKPWLDQIPAANLDADKPLNSGNPLLNLTGPFQLQANLKVKRRWDEGGALGWLNWLSLQLLISGGMIMFSKTVQMVREDQKKHKICK
ncbi:unnamed protein product [Nyctereutes procyonoides]|uniref:(raccoon dog) hypothetical protein n=1 Tax=Nyctereutes procyonoides TaxID=34880 RepID=A0A811Y7A3_NYCPR|nr:unnamed protein product [Nyctereutes procyonoides]